jgi:hypothetical protein
LGISRRADLLIIKQIIISKNARKNKLRFIKLKLTGNIFDDGKANLFWKRLVWVRNNQVKRGEDDLDVFFWVDWMIFCVGCWNVEAGKDS